MHRTDISYQIFSWETFLKSTFHEQLFQMTYKMVGLLKLHNWATFFPKRYIRLKNSSPLVQILRGLQVIFLYQNKNKILQSELIKSWFVQENRTRSFKMAEFDLTFEWAIFVIYLLAIEFFKKGGVFKIWCLKCFYIFLSKIHEWAVILQNSLRPLI